MNDQKVPSAPTPAPPTGNAGESLDKVRDILFGAQAREFDNRFAALEDQLLQKNAEARQEANRRLEALEAHVKQEVKQLTDSIKAEQAQRAEHIKTLTTELKSLAQTLEQKINQLDAKASKGQGELQQLFAAQSKSLTTELERRAETLSGALQREVKNLDDGKLNRVDIAAMFNEMAKRISGEKTK